MSLRDWPILRQLCPDFFYTIRTALVFGSTGNEALLITNHYKLYGIGKNFSGCLGVGDLNPRRLPTEVIKLSNKKMEGLACGGNFESNPGLFVVAYSQSGEIYQWGFIPRRPSSESITIPQKLVFNLDLKVADVACGCSHSMILCEDGRVFTWGNNETGQLGHSENQTNSIYNFRGSDQPYQVKGILEGNPVIDISCGLRFSAVLLHDGKVVTWGNNQFGQLGIGSTATHSMVPVEVSALNELEIEKVVCGSAHVLALGGNNLLALGGNNLLYGWGSNGSSQLGLSKSKNPTVTFYKSPVLLKRLVRLSQRMINIGASSACDLSVVEFESKVIFMFGKLSSGKILSRPTDSECESIDQVFAFYAKPNMMPKPMRHILKAKRRATMMDALENEFGNSDTSDLTIIVDGREIHVHQAILKIRSKYFRIFLDRWLETDKKVVTIKEKSFMVMNTYLKYLYTDKLEVGLNLAVESLQLADEYGDENFKSLCERNIKQEINADMVADVLLLTRKLKTCEDLNNFLMDFILNHKVEVFNSPGYERWDLDTTKAVLCRSAVKKCNC